MGNRVTAKTEVEGLDIHEMGVPAYVDEDSIAVQVAGEQHIAAHGPGVPGAKKDDRGVTVS
jgi:hypothetical protein